LPHPPLEVDPSERNPYNDPDWSPFLVTHNQSTDAAGVPQGGLLGRLLAALAEQSRGTSGNESSARAAKTDAALPEAQQPVRILGRRVVCY
jgi:hypothetical protein